jgi:hypothetical protein
MRSVYTYRMSTLTPQQFVATWANTQLKESAASLYNENPTWLQLTHRKLDAAVLDVYGWPSNLSDKETLCVARLLALNLERAG